MLYGGGLNKRRIFGILPRRTEKSLASADLVCCATAEWKPHWAYSSLYVQLSRGILFQGVRCILFHESNAPVVSVFYPVYLPVYEDDHPSLPVFRTHTK